MGQIPVEEQLGLDQKSADVIAGDLIVDIRRYRQRVRKVDFMQLNECVHRQFVAHFERGRRIALDDFVRAEIFQNHKSVVEIGGEDLRGGESEVSQSICERDKWLHVLGKMGDRTVGPSVLDRRPIRAPRRIHQNDLAVAA